LGRDTISLSEELKPILEVLNTGERCFKMSTADIKPLVDKIFISQRTTIFSQKYEATYGFRLLDGPNTQRQNLITLLKHKYQQIFTSRQLNRCLERCLHLERRALGNRRGLSRR
jgi:hypothetical protein